MLLYCHCHHTSVWSTSPFGQRNLGAAQCTALSKGQQEIQIIRRRSRLCGSTQSGFYLFWWNHCEYSSSYVASGLLVTRLASENARVLWLVSHMWLLLRSSLCAHTRVPPHTHTHNRKWWRPRTRLAKIYCSKFIWNWAKWMPCTKWAAKILTKIHNTGCWFNIEYSTVLSICIT